MKYRTLALLPLLFAVAIVGASLALPAWVWHGGLAASYGMAGVASLGAAVRFGPRDRLR